MHPLDIAKFLIYLSAAEASVDLTGPKTSNSITTNRAENKTSFRKLSSPNKFQISTQGIVLKSQ
jgi:hypothetical protein